MGVLTGKKVLTFGDSIVDGHLYKKAGFMEFVAEQEGMSVRKYANNGACVMPGNPVDEEGLGGMILEDQIRKAAEDGHDPDYVVFDGGTNDAYAPVMEKLGDPEEACRALCALCGGSGSDTDSGSIDSGSIDSGSGSDTDSGSKAGGASDGSALCDTFYHTFAGAFAGTVDAIQKNWPRAKVVYVAAHRLGYRDRAVQEALHRIEMNVCAHMGVAAADLYDDCALDTADEAMCRKYSFDVLRAQLSNRLPFLSTSKDARIICSKYDLPDSLPGCGLLIQKVPQGFMYLMGLSQYLKWRKRVGLDTVYYPISIIEFRQSRWTTIPPNIPPDGSQYPARSLYILPSIKSQLHNL